MTRQDAEYAHDIISATLSGKDVYYIADGECKVTETPTLQYLARKDYVIKNPFKSHIVPCTLYHESSGTSTPVSQFVRKYSEDGSVSLLVESETGELHPVLDGSMLRCGEVRLNIDNVIVTRAIVEGAE